MDDLSIVGDPITPERVVDAARPVDSPLHSYFEWDDAVAAALWAGRNGPASHD